MNYPDLTIPWTYAVQHEKLIYKTRDYEIFYFRLLIYLLISMLFTGQVILFFESTSIGIAFSLLLSFIMFLLLFPVWFKPWDIVLSNKRLILRSKRFYFVGRFAKVISYNLLHLESQAVTPRIKVGSVLLGFFILQVFSFPLIELGFSGHLPFPLFISLIIFYSGLMGLIKDFQSFQNQINELTAVVLGPFFDVSLFFGLFFMILALGLIIFGLPYKKAMILNTTGGQRFTLNAGLSEEFTNLLFAVGRKKRLKAEQMLKWDVPILEGEEVLSFGKVGLVNYSTQLLGMFTLFFFLDTINYFQRGLSNINIGFLAIVFIYFINFIFTIFAIVFSKRYHRIIATTHRLLFQEERLTVSGLWGKRVYRYSDVLKRDLQGFRVSRFTGITFYGLLLIFLVIVVGIYISIIFQSIQIVFLVFFIIIGTVIINYKAYTQLEFRLLSGNTHILAYRIPVIFERIAHQLEEHDRLHNLFFANILTDEDIINLCNNIRDIKNPLIPTEKFHDSERIRENAFIDFEEQESIEKWEKYGPGPYIRSGIIAGALLAFIAILVIVFSMRLIPPVFSTPFVLISIFMVGIITARNYILLFYSLIITKDRIFLVKQKLPRILSRILGVLPEWHLEEVNRKHVLLTRYAYFIPRITFSQVFFPLIIMGTSLLVLFNQILLERIFPQNLVEFIAFVSGVIIIFFIPGCMLLLTQFIPRYKLIIDTRFGIFTVPYIKQPKLISKILNEHPKSLNNNDVKNERTNQKIGQLITSTNPINIKRENL